MKKYLTIAAVAIAALSSCTSNDDITVNDNTVGETGVTQFTATIEGAGLSSRSTLNSSNTPEWVAGDKIMVGSKEYTATGSGTTTTFTGEEVSGSTHHAYYPSTMVTKITGGYTVALPAEYTYEAGRLNMPMYAYSKTTDLKFKNLTGVIALKVTNSDIASVKTVTVTSDQAISGSFSVTLNDDNTDWESIRARGTDDASKTITITCPTAVTTTSAGTIFYIPIPEDCHILTFAVSDGTNTKTMTTVTGSDIERSKLYTLTFKAPHEYVGLGLSVKWATCNVGATSPTEYGGYYAWGETEEKTDYSWSTYFDTTDGGSTFTKYALDKKTVLDATDDVAHVKWGGNWRMPTEDEMEELIKSDNCTWTWYDSGNSEFNGVAGYKVQSKITNYTDKYIFLPAAGDYFQTGLIESESYGYYSSSSIGSLYSKYVRRLSFYSSSHSVGNDNRSWGFSIRPVRP